MRLEEPPCVCCAVEDIIRYRSGEKVRLEEPHILTRTI